MPPLSPTTHPLRLGTALSSEAEGVRELLVAPLPSDPSRGVDLRRVEVARLARLGEGRPEALADSRVPASLQQVLESGPRAVQRLRQALAYAEKWHRRGDLPAELAPPLSRLQLLACLPRPLQVRRAEGVPLDPRHVRGSGAALRKLPQPTLAAIGQFGGRPVGFCLAVEDLEGVVLGTWLNLDFELKGCLELRVEGHRRELPFATWEGLAIPALQAGEVLLLPPPRLRPLRGLVAGASFEVRAGFDTLRLSLDRELVHPTVQ